MSFKILAIGDQHFQTNNVIEVEKFIYKLEEWLQNNKVDLIVPLGDLCHYHERLHTSCLNKANYFIDILRKFAPVYILVGNHDMINHLQFLEPNGHWLNVFKDKENVTVVDTVKTLTINSYNLVFCPYVEPGRFKEALDTVKDWTGSHLIFAHQEFFNVKMGAINSVVGDIYDEKLPQVISGHIHDRQILQKNIYYTGSCMQHAFGEDARKSIGLIEISPSFDINISEVYFKLPKKKIIYHDIETVESLEIKESENKIKLCISGNYEHYKTFKKSKKYKELKQQGIVVEYKKKKIYEEEKEEKEDNFEKILRTLVKKENNINLTKAYESVFNEQ